MGGVCIALYGFIAVSGLKMIQDANLDDNRNLFVVSVILIAGIGGLTLTFGDITLTEVAAALILGILTNVMLSRKRQRSQEIIITKLQRQTVFARYCTQKMRIYKSLRKEMGKWET